MGKRIAILGAGNIGLAIAEGIYSSVDGNRMIITRRSGVFSMEEHEKFQCLTDNKQAVSSADILIVAVQPKQVDGLLIEIKDSIRTDQLLISVASGVSIERIVSLLGEMPVARAMPNTAIRVQQSMTCLAFNEVGRKYQTLVTSIFDAVGKTLVIPESKFTEATGLCGSGTAFGLKYIRGYMQACIQHGFNEKDALTIASQVVKGSAMIVEGADRHPEVEIDRVTTPDGCTIAGLVEMDHAGFVSALLRGLRVCIDRARKLYS